MSKKKRPLTLTLTALVGQIHEFSAVVDGEVVIDGEDGTTERTFEGDIAKAPVTVVIWVTGVSGSKYKINIDLPGKADDFAITQTLTGGLQQVKFDV